MLSNDQSSLLIHQHVDSCPLVLLHSLILKKILITIQYIDKRRVGTTSENTFQAIIYN